MAMTLTQQNDMYRFFAVAFGAAPGVTYMTQLGDAVDAGMTTKQIVNVFTTKSQFTDVYHSYMTNDAFATLLVNNVVQGSASDAAKAQAVSDIVAAINSGYSRGDVIYQVFSNLAAKDPSDATWGGTATLLAHEVDVARYFTETLGGNSTDLSLLRSVLANVTATTDTSSPAAIAALITLPGQSYVLTAAQDNLTGTIGNDTFMATDATLQSGDKINGGAGTDTLVVSANGPMLVAPTLKSVEVIQVNAPNVVTPSIEIDLSNSDGVNTLQSFQVTDYNGPGEGSLVAFYDIQNVNNTKISITDTNVDHEFTYDTNAYLRNAAGTAVGNTVDLTVQEFKDANITFGNDLPYTPGASEVNTVNLVSASRAAGVGGSGVVDNQIHQLAVGANLATLNISGDANLAIDHAIDTGVALVDAHALAANLTLIDNTLTSVGTFTYVGAQGKDNLTVGRAGNNNISTGTGDDTVVVTGNGNQAINTGTGNDAVTIAGNGMDSISLGDGNDHLTIVGRVDNYNTPLVGDGVSTIDAGAGNDVITITGAVAPLNAPSLTGAQAPTSYIAGAYNIALGDGNDILNLTGSGSQTIDAGAGNDTVSLNGDGAAKGLGDLVSLGDGNDLLTINHNGSYNESVSGGAGDDTITINGAGSNSILGGDGNDVITINGNGKQYVNLGEGDNSLVINGSASNSLDNASTSQVTTIVAGAGSDTVAVNYDHILNVDLGAGDDTLMIRAQDLTADDTITAGSGIDTLVLTNTSLDAQYIGRSETTGTTGFEVFDLRNNNITLALTDAIINSATNKAVTVSTQLSTGTEVPVVTLVSTNVVVPFVQNMTVAAFDAMALQWRNGAFNESPTKSYYDNYAIANYLGTVVQVEAQIEAKAKADMITWIEDQGVNVAPTDTNSNGNQWDATDTVAFTLQGRNDPTQTIDLTGLTVVPTAFTLDGGSLRDIVIANDQLINGRMTLDFGSSPSNTSVSVNDTLRVVDGANITAADLRNVTGMERIELVASGTHGAQTWHVELTDTVINQTTANAPLVIHVATDVPAGSALYVKLNPDLTNANSNVIIEKNANVAVYIDIGDGTGYHQVTEPQWAVNYGEYHSFNIGGYGLYVDNELHLTTNADDLHGYSGQDNVFVADSLNELQAADNVIGGIDGNNTLQLNFAVSNEGFSGGFGNLDWQLHTANVQDVQTLWFNTVDNVNFDGIDYYFDTALQTVITGAGDDRLLNVRGGVEYQTGAGNDLITGEDYQNQSITVDGGAGQDTVQSFAPGEDYSNTGYDHYWTINNVETVYGASYGWDEVTVQTPASQADSGLIYMDNVEQIYLDSYSGPDAAPANASGASITSYMGYNLWADHSSGYDDYIGVHASAGNDTIQVGSDSAPNYTSVWGGAGHDFIQVYAHDYAEVYGDNNNSTAAGQGNDTINVEMYNSYATAYVYGEGGNDSINVYQDGSGYSETYVDGGTGDDKITVGSHTDNLDYATVHGGDGNDSIYVTWQYDATVDGGNGNDTIIALHNSYNNVTGGAGDDSITVETHVSATIDGGSGNDTIDASNWNSSASTVLGGTGDDSITTHGSNGTFDITGGAGNDTINLTDTFATVDTLRFGTIDYNNLQVQLDNYQGLDTITGFVFEGTGGDPAPATQDLMDFSAFLGGAVNHLNEITLGSVWSHGTTVAANAAAGNSLVVLSGPNLTLSSTDFSTGLANTIQLNDNGRAVVVVGTNQTGPLSGIGHFDVYYVQDIDSTGGGAGHQTWQVDKVASVTAATLVGLASVIDNLNLNLGNV